MLVHGAFHLAVLESNCFASRSGAANDAVGLILALVLPWWALIEFGRVGRWWGILIAVLAFIPLLLYSGLVFLFSAMGAGGALERVAEVDWRGSVFCV